MRSVSWDGGGGAGSESWHIRELLLSAEGWTSDLIDEKHSPCKGELYVESGAGNPGTW